MSLSTDYSKSATQANSIEIQAKDINLSHLNADACAVLEFWFDENNEAYWFEKNDAFDQRIEAQFNDIWHAAKQGECAPWRRSESPTDANSAVTDLAGRLAEIIVLDQFSRNLCRNQACSFTQDSMSVVLAQEAVHQAQFNTLPAQWRKFMIMPFMHSESAVIHKRYLPLFEQLNDANTLDFEHKHLAIVEQFGRYPHRNEVLDRESTAEELEFLQQPNSSF